MPAGHPTRRDILAAGAAALLAPRLAGARRTGPDRRPNILFILADDLGYGDLGCYGQSRIRTPYLDALAAAGTRFTDAYAGSTVCAPSRCCLMTGYHTGHARIRGNARVPLEPGDVTVATTLREAGYATGLFGSGGSAIPARQDTRTGRASTSSSATATSATPTTTGRLTCGATKPGSTCGMSSRTRMRSEPAWRASGSTTRTTCSSTTPSTSSTAAATSRSSSTLR